LSPPPSAVSWASAKRCPGGRAKRGHKSPKGAPAERQRGRARAPVRGMPLRLARQGPGRTAEAWGGDPEISPAQSAARLAPQPPHGGAIRRRGRLAPDGLRLPACRQGSGPAPVGAVLAVSYLRPSVGPCEHTGEATPEPSTTRSTARSGFRGDSACGPRVFTWSPCAGPDGRGEPRLHLHAFEASIRPWR
jgi:hypothetical protein